MGDDRPTRRLSIDEARTEADKLRGDVARGHDPKLEWRKAHASSLAVFIEKEYGPWALAHRKTGAETLSRAWLRSRRSRS